MKDLIKSAWGLVQENRKAYITLNVVYYGLVAVCMVYVAFDQELQKSLLDQIGAAFMTGPLSFVGQAYVNTQALTAILATFFVNLLLGSLAVITLPSLVVPFSGILVGVYRAIVWGLLLSPANPDLRLVMIPHSITLILEGQAYILAMFAAYLQGRAFLFPGTVGLESRAKGYVEGLKRTGKLYALVVLTLAVAAIYEVAEVIIIIKFFS
ncbi:stage II sporulation protein M [Chloroflexi bacterium CFX6]|nr:stage II sporulation protein M [Chloroflexi bacterium CFX6]